MRNLIPAQFAGLFVFTICLLFSVSAHAHTIELRAKLNSDGSATFYARTYHIISSPTGSFIVDGVSYPFTSTFNQASLPAGTVLISKCNYTFSNNDVYQVVTVPNFNSCVVHTFNCSSGAVEAPNCSLSNSLNLGEAQITLQPAFANGVACVGSTGYLTVEASGPNLGFQWQKWNGSSFANITDDATYTGSTTAQLAIHNVTNEMNGDRFRCEVKGTDDCNNTSTTHSNEVTLVPGYAPSLITDPADITTCAGYNIALSGSATGTALTYQWKVSTNGGASWSNTGTNTSTLYISNVPIGNNGYRYRLDLSGNCGTASSSMALLSVYNAPAITLQPQSQSICEGNAVTFSASATGSGLSFQWQHSTDAGNSWSDVQGATATSVSFVPATSENGKRYRAVVTGTCTTTYSNAATLTVNSWVNKITGQSSTGSFTNNNSWTFIDQTIVVNESSNVSNARITVAENFVSGDVLNVSGTLPSGVTQSYDGSRGILSVNGTMTPAEMQDIFRRVQFRTNNASLLPRKFSFSMGAAIPHSNGHFYEYVSGTITWTAAKAAAEARSLSGMQGYLATITSQEENDFIRTKLTNDGWVGGSDDYQYINAAVGYTLYANQAASEGHWYWIAGPEAGQKISTGNNNPVTAPGAFANWASGEPNNAGNEHYMQVYFGNAGKWNDLPNNNLPGYIVEYGGLTADPCNNLTFERTLNVNQSPQISAIGTQSVCENSNFTVSFSVSDDGDINSITMQVATSNATLLPAGTYSLTSTGSGNYQLQLTPYGYGTGTVTITATDAFDATATSSFNVDVAANPLVNFTVNTAIQCYTQNQFQFSNNSSVASGTLTYTWSFGDNNQSSGTNPAHSYAQDGAYTVTLQAASNRGCTGNATMQTILLPDFTIGAVAAQTHLVCNPATTQVTITPSNGVGNIIYTIQKPGGGTEIKTVAVPSVAVFTIAGGIYTITAQNGNAQACLATNTVTVTQLPAIRANLFAENATCYGTATGVLAVYNVSGGTPPYMYSMDGMNYISAPETGPVFPNVSASTFNTYIRDANGCVQPIGTTTILQPPRIQVNVTQSPVTPCSNNTSHAIIAASGGKGSYTYSIDGSDFSNQTAYDLTVGEHRVAVNDAAGCTITSTIDIIRQSVLNFSTLSATHNSCVGGTLGSVSAQLTAAAGSVTYQLSGVNQTRELTVLSTSAAVFNNLPSGTYTVTATDNSNCTAISTINITEPQSVQGSTNGAADLSINDVSGLTRAFSAATGNQLTLTYEIGSTSVTNVAARNVVVRITKLFSSYTINLLQAENIWTKTAEGDHWTEFKLNSDVAINCGGSVMLKVVMTRQGTQTTTGSPVTATVRYATGANDLQERNNYHAAQWSVKN